MSREYISHVKQNKSGTWEEPHPLSTHSLDTAIKAKDMATDVGFDWTGLAGRWHDLGKSMFMYCMPMKCLVEMKFNLGYKKKKTTCIKAGGSCKKIKYVSIHAPREGRDINKPSNKYSTKVDSSMFSEYSEKNPLIRRLFRCGERQEKSDCSCSNYQHGALFY